MGSERLVVHEIKSVGHCVPHAFDLARDAVGPDREVLLVLNGMARDQFASLRGADAPPDGLEVRFTDPIELPGGLIDVRSMEIDHLETVLAKERPDRILSPTADGLIRRGLRSPAFRRLIARSGCDWDLVVHLSPAAAPTWRPRSLLRSLTNATDLALLRRARLFSPDPFFTLGPGRSRLFPGGRCPVSFLPFRVHGATSPGRADARRSCGLPEGDRLLVVPGMIEPRKDIRRLLAARTSLAGLIDGILLAGMIAPSLRAEIEHASSDPGLPELHIRDRFLGTNEFADTMQSADLIWAVYPGWQGIASVQVGAGAMGCRTLVDRNHPSAAWIASRTEGSTVLGDSVADSVETALRTDPGDRTFFERISSASVRRAVLGSSLRVRTLEELRDLHVEADVS